MKNLLFIILLISIVFTVGCVNNLGISGSYINLQNNQTCLDMSSDGTYLIRSVGSSLSIQEKYKIENNKLLLTLPTDFIFGQNSQNEIFVTCDVNGKIINCGKEGGIYEKVDSCSVIDPARIIPTPVMPSYACLANTRLWTSQPDKEHVTLNLKYQDICGLTTDVRFIVKSAKDLKVIYDQDLGNPGTGVVYANYTHDNIRGVGYFWAYNATRDTQ
jgi:hypothetical protein